LGNENEEIIKELEVLKNDNEELKAECEELEGKNEELMKNKQLSIELAAK
jgi:hypothetical protein